MKSFSAEKFKDVLAKKAPEWELVGNYYGARKRTTFRHKNCGAVVAKIPYNLFSKPNSCRTCNAKRLSGGDAFFEQVKHKNDYVVLGKYKNNRTKIKIRHKICGNDFWATPDSFTRSREGCPFCKNDTISKVRTWTHERFLEEIGERGEEYEFLERYKNAHTPLRVRHICGDEFSITPDSFLRGSRCKSCKYSTGEGQVYRLIKKLLPGEEVIQGDRTILPNGAEIDIYIPNMNFGIEYDGLAYHTYEHFMADKNRKWTKTQAKNRHLWKTEECFKKGIRLVHIFEDEWLEHPEIVEDKLRAILKLPMKKYYARSLTVKVAPKKQAQEFLDANHIQGRSRAVVSVGLYDGDTLVAVQSFLRDTRQKKVNVWELARYATLLGSQVVGGFSRCLKWFEREYHPDEVISFADKRWCSQTSNVYEKNGFKRVRDVAPSYWYVLPPKRFHKSRFRKKAFKTKYPSVYSPDKTEAQMAKEAKLKKIYDCGLVKYSNG